MKRVLKWQSKLIVHTQSFKIQWSFFLYSIVPRIWIGMFDRVALRTNLNIANLQLSTLLHVNPPQHCYYLQHCRSKHIALKLILCNNIQQQYLNTCQRQLVFEHEIKDNNQSECKQHKTINHHHHPLESHNYLAINRDSIKIFFISINYHQTLLNDPPSASTRTTYRNLQQQRWNYIYAFIRRSYIMWGEKNTHDHVKMFAKDKIIIIVKKPNGLLVLGSNWHNRRRREDGQQQQLPCSFNNIVAAHDRRRRRSSFTFRESPQLPDKKFVDRSSSFSPRL